MPRMHWPRLRLIGALVVTMAVITPMTTVSAAQIVEQNFDGLADQLQPAADESIPEDVLGWTQHPTGRVVS